MSETYYIGEKYGATARINTTGSCWLSPSCDVKRRLYSEDEMRDLYDLLDEQFGDEDNGPERTPVAELLDDDESGDTMIGSLDVSSMNTRPIDELFIYKGRVMADNDRDHDAVVTMGDVEAEIQSLCERVSDLERGEQQ